MRITFIFLLIFFKSISQERVKIEHFFSPTGDTVLIFGGTYQGNAKFHVAKRQGTSILLLDSFNISNKEKYIKQDYPLSLIQKYYLNVPGSVVDLSPDLVISQKILKNKKLYTHSSWGGQPKLFEATFLVTIQVCNKTILNKKIKREYLSSKKEAHPKLKNSDLPYILLKMENQPIYYFCIETWDTFLNIEGSFKSNANNSSIFVKCEW